MFVSAQLRCLAGARTEATLTTAKRPVSVATKDGFGVLKSCSNKAWGRWHLEGRTYRLLFLGVIATGILTCLASVGIGIGLLLTGITVFAEL